MQLDLHRKIGVDSYKVFSKSEYLDKDLILTLDSEIIMLTGCHILLKIVNEKVIGDWFPPKLEYRKY